MLTRLFKEPLVHFLALAVVIFAVYGLLQPAGTSRPESIVVSAAKIDQLASVFAKTWQRPPTSEELQGLIDDYVKEEVYVREALALGLDQDDTVIRRRLRLKMEFMDDLGAAVPAPTDADLEAYLSTHAAQFASDPQVGFEQVFLSPERRGERIEQDAGAILRGLRTNASADPASLGDATLLPYEMPLASKATIAATFGAKFAANVSGLDVGQWSGPIRSDFGLHIVQVSARRPGGTPSLAAIRADVVRAWTDARRKELEARRFDDLLARYAVTIAAASTDAQ